MLAVYRTLLSLYPAEYRRQFSDEMLGVFQDACADQVRNGLAGRGVFFLREFIDLAVGAFREQLRSFTSRAGFPIHSRRFDMRDGFRFPKASAILMTLILGGVVYAIKMGENISASVPHELSPQIPPIQSVHSVLLSGIPLFFAIFYAAGLIGWAILFAMRRSGVHRLDEMGTPKN